jgi:hypothetical protein
MRRSSAESPTPSVSPGRMGDDPRKSIEGVQSTMSTRESNRSAVPVTRVTWAGPCRHCGAPAFLADTTGPVHLCCRWWIEDEGRPRCPACAMSRALRAAHQRKRARKGRVRNEDPAPTRRRRASRPRFTRGEIGHLFRFQRADRTRQWL